VLGGVSFERWRAAGVEAVPHAIAVPEVVAPSSSAESNPKKPMPETPRARRRESHTPVGAASEPHGTVMEQGSNSDGTATGTQDAKP
jgi:hypothetical protein